MSQQSFLSPAKRYFSQQTFFLPAKVIFSQQNFLSLCKAYFLTAFFRFTVKDKNFRMQRGNSLDVANEEDKMDDARGGYRIKFDRLTKYQ